MEIWEALENERKLLSESLSTLANTGIDYCKANKEYHIAKTKEILRLKKEGMPITLIPQMIKGIEEVAELDFKRNATEVIYKANLEAINVHKLEIKVIEKQIEREYGNE